jgi:uncharacterized protein YacL
MEILSEQANQFATLAGILGGLTLAVIVELFLADDKRKLVTAMTLVFCVATFMFLFSMVANMLVVTATVELEEVRLSISYFSVFTLFVTLGGVQALLIGLGLAGWLHSKLIGGVTTILALLTSLAIIFTFFFIFNQM